MDSVATQPKSLSKSMLLWALQNLPEDLWTRGKLCPPNRVFQLLTSSKKVLQLVKQFRPLIPAILNVEPKFSTPFMQEKLPRLVQYVQPVSVAAWGKVPTHEYAGLLSNPACFDANVFKMPDNILYHENLSALSDILMQASSWSSVEKMCLSGNQICHKRPVQETESEDGSATVANTRYTFFRKETESNFSAADPFVRLLGQSTALKTLDLSRNGLNRMDIKHLSLGLANLSTLERLRLSNNPLGTIGVKYVMKALNQSQPPLSVLDLASCGMSKAGCMTFADCCLQWDKLTVLNISGNGIFPDGLFRLAQHASSMSKLSVLNVSTNRLTIPGAKVLAEEMLPHLPQLTELIANDNYFQDEGITVLSFCLQVHCPLLRRLDLAMNRFTKNAVQDLVLFLVARKETLQVLNLAHNMMYADGIAELVQFLPTSLRELNLSANSVRTAAIGAAIGDVLHTIPEISVLNLSFNKLGICGCRQIVDKCEELDFTQIHLIFCYRNLQVRDSRGKEWLESHIDEVEEWVSDKYRITLIENYDLDKI